MTSCVHLSPSTCHTVLSSSVFISVSPIRLWAPESRIGYDLSLNPQGLEQSRPSINDVFMKEWVNGNLRHFVPCYTCLAPNLHGQFSHLMICMHLSLAIAYVLPKDWKSGLTVSGVGPFVFRMRHCFGGICIGVVKGMVTHFMRAVLSWWEISGVRPASLGMRIGWGVQSKVR